MATIEELRQPDSRGCHTTFYLDAYADADPPDKVLLCFKNTDRGEVLWLTADGELHFGAQALAGLTRALRAQLHQEFVERLEVDHRVLPAQVATLNCRSGEEVVPELPLTDEQALEGMRQWDAEILRLREQEAARTEQRLEITEKNRRAMQPHYRNPFEAHKPLE